MAVSRRQFLAAALGSIGALSIGGCGTDEPSESVDADGYLLPILKPGETMRLSSEGVNPIPFAFFPRKNRAALVLSSEPGAVPTSSLEVFGAKPASETVVHGRRVQLLEGFYIVRIDDEWSVGVMGIRGPGTPAEIAESFGEFSVSDDQKVVMGGWTKFELKEQGQIRRYVNEQLVESISFARPVPNSLAFSDRFDRTSQLTIGPDTLQTVDLGGSYVMWVEPDGLEVWAPPGSADRSNTVSAMRARYRRVSKAEWEKAKAENPYPPPVTEPPDVAQIKRDTARRSSPGVVIAADFLADPRGVDDQTRWDVRIVDSVPLDAAYAAIYRVNARLRVLQVDGAETYEGDFNSQFNEEDSELGVRGGVLQTEFLAPEARAAIVRIITEEFAYAGVTSARISSTVIENE